MKLLSMMLQADRLLAGGGRLLVAGGSVKRQVSGDLNDTVWGLVAVEAFGVAVGKK